MGPVSVMLKPSSGGCNMQCAYCFYCDEQNKRDQFSYGMMSEETLKNTIRKVLGNAEGSCLIAFQGGEPTLRGLDFFRKAVDLVQHYNRKHVRVQFAFQTNGTNITDEWAEFFYENHFLVGVSLDGTRENHNRYRKMKTGEDSFDRALQGCAILEKHRVEFNILTVVHKYTAKQIRQIYAFLRKKNFDYLQFINCLDPLGEAPGQREWSLLPEEYGQFLIDLFDCWYEEWKQGHHPYVRQFENYVGLLMGYLPEACDMGGTCSRQFLVEADGSTYPCDFYAVDDCLLGNMNTDTIKSMDEKREEIRFIEASKPVPEECRMCEFVRLCRNGCRRCRGILEDGAFMQEGIGGAGTESSKNYFCEGYRMFFRECLPRMKEIAASGRYLR